MHRWTAKELYKLIDMGFFRDRRVELIEGVLVVMPAPKNFHPLSVSLTQAALQAAFGPGFWVRVQAALDLSPHSDVDPDLAVVPGNPRDYNTPNNPTTALLIVEVSDTTLHLDRTRKASLYARVGISDYWIVNLVDRQLEVHRNPVPDRTQRFGFTYADVVILSGTDHVSPLAAPQSQILVADLLP
jgi:Uma2 family endonuclease